MEYEGLKADSLEGYPKINRILSLYDSLNKGNIINKKQAATKFSVREKAIQRDLDDLRAYLGEKNLRGENVIVSLITIAQKKDIF